jgi:hypothetical protein
VLILVTNLKIMALLVMPLHGASALLVLYKQNVVCAMQQQRRMPATVVTTAAAAPADVWQHLVRNWEHDTVQGSGDAAYLLCMLCCLYIQLLPACQEVKH